MNCRLFVEKKESFRVEAFVNEARQLKKFNGDFSYENKRDNDFFSMILYNLLPSFSPR